MYDRGQLHSLDARSFGLRYPYKTVFNVFPPPGYQLYLFQIYNHIIPLLYYWKLHPNSSLTHQQKRGKGYAKTITILADSDELPHVHKTVTIDRPSIAQQRWQVYMWVVIYERSAAAEGCAGNSSD
jgi:hypothetical protein